MRFIFPFFFFFFCAQNATAMPHFEFTPLARRAYDKALSLRFAEAYGLLAQLQKQDPDNLIADFIENYIDFFTVFINEDEDEFHRLEKNKDRRLDKIKKGDQTSPYFLYTQAEINLQWAMARLKFGEYFTAFNEVSSAHKLLKNNIEKFPDFIANKKSLGILQAAAGTIPDSYQWGVRFLSGIRGSIPNGRRQIEEIIAYSEKNDFIFEQETLVMYAFLMLHLENQSEEAWKIIHSSRLQSAQNPLACFALANVAQRTGRNEDALKLLENRPQGAGFHPFYFLDYMFGLSKLYRQDADADKYLLRFAQNFKGINYLKECYQKLAWHALVVRGDAAAYKSYLAQCKTHGKTNIGGDKNAQREAESGNLPDLNLLKARLLFDGGYFVRADEALRTTSEYNLPTKDKKLEYQYRMGRIQHRLGKTSEAVRFYQKTIDEGRYEPYYFACNAALQMGQLYEDQRQREKAKQYYRLCLDISPDEHKTGLHQKAKSGLERLK